MPDDLSNLAARGFFDGRDQRFGVDVGLARHFQLDELVALERGLERGQHAFGQALRPELHDRLELVRERAQVALLFAIEGGRRWGRLTFFRHSAR